MKLPSIEEFFLPILQHCADREVHTPKTTFPNIIEKLKFTEEEINHLLPSGKQTTLENRINWSMYILSQASLLNRPIRGKYTINKRGLNVLAEKPEKITREFLSQFKEYQEYLKKSRKDDTDAPDDIENYVDEDSDLSNCKMWIFAPGRNAHLWGQAKEEETINIGWNDTGDVREYITETQLANAVPEYSASTRNMIWNFAKNVKQGDLIIVKQGRRKLLGMGVINGDYFFDKESNGYQHCLPCRWISTDEFNTPEGVNAPLKTLTGLTHDSPLRLFINNSYGESENLDVIVDEDVNAEPEQEFATYTKVEALKDLFISESKLDTILRQLHRKLNVILEGAPGVGKTFVAKRLAYLIQGSMRDDTIETIQFHQSYSYEDFIQGLRPKADGSFAVKDGIFYNIAKKAELAPKVPHFLIIDEINRGNLSKIFGELMMLVEADKRGSKHALRLTYSDKDSAAFYVPKNLFIIGTMNTADKSLSVVDFALRRRFAFIRLNSGFESERYRSFLQEKGVNLELIDQIKSRIAKVNQAIKIDTMALGPGYEIGHSFFTPLETLTTETEQMWYQDVIDYEIAPLLNEYFVDQPEVAEEHIASLR